MIQYYSYAICEKILSFIPGGDKIYYHLGSFLQHAKKGRTGPKPSAINLLKKTRTLLKQGGNILDVGTGWFHHEAFLWYLIGGYNKLYLFDVKDKAQFNYIQNYLNGILDNIEYISNEFLIDKIKSINKIKTLLNLNTRDEIYKVCNFIPVITTKTNELFLPENSIDLMISNCVLNHIPKAVLIPEMKILGRILKKTGYMYYLIGHDDHWAFRDHRANMFQYYKYSDFYYRLIFDTKFQFQNRYVKQEWLDIFQNCNLKVEEYIEYSTDKSKAEIKKISSSINKRFSKFPLQDLAIIYSFVTLKK